MNNKVIFTNGCFDILHIGHIRLLKYAKSLGNYLIVGLNSDESIKRLKGYDRPFNKIEYRKEVIESIKWVDEVKIFTEDTPSIFLIYSSFKIGTGASGFNLLHLP